MKEELKKVMSDEFHSLEKLLDSLLIQQQLLIKKDVFGLDKMVTEIEKINKEVATSEMSRLKLVENKTMKELLKEQNDQSLNKLYLDMRGLLERIKFQKDSNELLIKQGLIFTTKVLNAINPNGAAKTYNCYGKTK
ncbi:flagellar biosynthesis/type III secretory pathway chaperone [Clostridium acetobutylicum]|uniref:Uncharacterized protein n=1 Tax=Clostridium acetobutylicum (strain ATCC 824 / DSM 792 / JCM 1419 / IAM 19013 / LMG 5710 / NBRC 13948 / NRRL B-527 / VKM B-1787 / 2291 / W) TaxID=272562 RepID=Q97H02_CLOAB|nr:MULTISPECIES: flagellar protein FlgN [Clostridium]AAK80170.1 Hypothetical protein CA_C2213 [Clostridium acetobutylicum ATCC 824]ADZ21264.1 Conserved hypothetical protein [Clostridium acetobutylicum EA 2018]AEI32234.1 hypothetical protein SMB_G2246 [Clostridium acetobutylicum DSM 1731]AWV79404.1 flagellar protein FlgN [Clostridium acetobutylicum]KHD38356.1 hypothetical protein NL50_02290 [Clostridium acetobutylicum]